MRHASSRIGAILFAMRGTELAFCLGQSLSCGWTIAATLRWQPSVSHPPTRPLRNARYLPSVWWYPPTRALCHTRQQPSV
eukprot:3067608-Rhodomonas_salina.1